MTFSSDVATAPEPNSILLMLLGTGWVIAMQKLFVKGLQATYDSRSSAIIRVLMHHICEAVLIALQCFVVLFAGLHNWIPLGSLNDVKGAKAAFPGSKLLTTTLTNVIPFSVGLAGCVLYFGRRYPDWLFLWLWISYALACAGSLKAWWVPYLVRPNPELAARYQVMYGTTHSFLPRRNEITPNTLHVILDVATIVVLIVLLVVTIQQGRF